MAAVFVRKKKIKEKKEKSGAAALFGWYAVTCLGLTDTKTTDAQWNAEGGVPYKSA